MSQQDGFAGGFFTGIVVGGIVGGIVGAIASAKTANGEDKLKFRERFKADNNSQLSGDDSMETARLSLEDKIAQLNNAIDDVRQQLGAVNGHSEDEIQ